MHIRPVSIPVGRNLLAKEVSKEVGSYKTDFLFYKVTRFGTNWAWSSLERHSRIISSHLRSIASSLGVAMEEGCCLRSLSIHRSTSPGQFAPLGFRGKKRVSYKLGLAGADRSQICNNWAHSISRGNAGCFSPC